MCYRLIKHNQTDITDNNDTFADCVMNLDKDNEYHVNMVQCECPFAEIEPLTTHYQEMTHHISINSLSTTNTRLRHNW